MTIEAIIDSLNDQARDKDSFVHDDDECDDIFAEDARNLRAAAELLKRWAPRLLTLEAAKAADIVWLEDRDKSEVIPALCLGHCDYTDGQARTRFIARTGTRTYKSIYPLDADYMVRYRCWTTCPDEAQREDTPWAQ